jgi:hypothetical protein
MELAQLLADYPSASLIVGGWIILFAWLLWSTQQQSAKREERLISANERFSAALDKVAENVATLVAEVRNDLRGR